MEMPDGTSVAGVRVSGTSKSALMARYQQWRSSIPPLPKGSVLHFQQLHSYTVKAAFKTEGSWAEVLLSGAVAWLVIHLALVTVRGAVLYVAVGRFLPVGGLRGWLTL